MPADTYQERGILDPISEDANNLPLEITGGMVPDGQSAHAIGLREWSFPRPPVESNFIKTSPTEGEKRTGPSRYGNRVIPVEVYIAESMGVGLATNLVTNPSFERDLAGWLTTVSSPLVAGGVLTRVQQGVSGEYCANLVASGANMGLRIDATLAATTNYVLRFKARKITGAIVSLTGAAGAVSMGAVATLSTDWETFELPFTSVVAGATSMSLRANAVGTFQVDALQVVLAASQDYYFDGDTPGCEWTGTPHASTSLRLGTGTDKKRFQQAVYDLESKLEKMARSGGTLKRYCHDGTTEVFDVLDATFTNNWARTMAQGQVIFNFELTCKPAARLAPITFTTRTKVAAKSILKSEEGPIPGNYPALGKLEITDTGSVNRNFLLATVQSEDLSLAATAEVEYLAKNLTPLSGAALANTPGSAGNTNGGSTNGTILATMADGWSPFLSGKTLAGAYPTHIGQYRIWVRCWLPVANTGTVSLRLDYAAADLTRWSSNDAVSIPYGTGAWKWFDLGPVRLEPPTSLPWGSSGAWRWEPRISAMSTVGGDTIYFDALEIFAADEFYSEARPNPMSQPIAGGLIARGLGAAASSVLVGRTAQSGGVWSGAGDADDFSVNLSTATATRSPSGSDAAGSNTGHFGRLGAGVQPGVSVAVNQQMSTYPIPGVVGYQYLGVFARYTDINNHVKGVLIHDGATYQLAVMKFKAGVLTTLAMKTILITPSSYYDLKLTVLADGSGTLFLGNTYGETISFNADADLATGGTLATGGYGIYHSAYRSTWSTPSLMPNNITAPVVRSIVTADAPPDLVLASGRNAILTNDRALRTSADGTAIGDIGRYEGDRLLIPCSGKEGKLARIAVMDHRVDPDNAADSNLDTLSYTLTVIPRVLDVPEPA